MTSNEIAKEILSLYPDKSALEAVECARTDGHLEKFGVHDIRQVFEIVQTVDKMKERATFIEWIKDMETPLTVGDMRKLIEGMDDDVQIVVGVHEIEANAEWCNLLLYSEVDEEGGIYALSLQAVDNFDARQF